MHDWRHHDGHEHGHGHGHGHIPHGEFIDGSEWRPQYRIDYSPHGDNLDRFVLKVRGELERIYHLLRRLRRLDASAGHLADTVPYQLHADTASRRLLIRDSKNEKWIELGKLDESFFGITPEDIGAVRNAGIGAFYSGYAADLPKTANINDIFYSLDEKKIYFYSGTSWELLASLNSADLYGLEEFSAASLSSFVTKDELSTTLTDYALNSALSNSEKIIVDDILKLFNGSGSAIIGGDSSVWTKFALASEEDISELFQEG